MAIKFTDNSAAILRMFDTAQAKALAAIGATGEKHAKKETPVDTGRLRNSMANAVFGNAAYIGTNVEYGPYVEMGTRYMQGHHMIQKACQNHSDEYKRIAEAAYRSEE